MIKSFKYLFILILILQINLFPEIPPSSKATGFFVAFGVGPRIPVSQFADTSAFGYGVNVEFSYTDNEYLPVFLFADFGFQQYSGSQKFYNNSVFSNYTLYAFPVNIGARYYFPPLMENIVLLMPIVQASANYTYTNTLYKYDEGIRTPNFTTNKNQFGFSAGAGFSMFMMELLASYNYVPGKQFISVDLKVRIPIYINI